VSARYSITPAHRISGNLGRLEYNESGQAAAGLFEKYEKTVWDIGWEASWGGPWRTALSYGRAGDGKCALSGGAACSTAGLKSSQFNAGVAYDFSKRTFLYAMGAWLDLGESAIYDNWTATGSVPPRGADVTQWALGIAHNF
jgi:predicted porin